MKKSKKPIRWKSSYTEYGDSVHWGRQTNMLVDILNSYLAKQLMLAGYKVTIHVSRSRIVAIWNGERMVCAVEPVHTGTRTSWAVLGSGGIERYGAWEDVEDAVNRLINEESC